jgi:hypothetical protein
MESCIASCAIIEQSVYPSDEFVTKIDAIIKKRLWLIEKESFNGQCDCYYCAYDSAHDERLARAAIG